MTPEPEPIDAALEALRRVACARPGVAHELELSRGEFFGGDEPQAPRAVALPAARRHLEWFLLERPSAALGGVPVEWALQRVDEIDAPDLEQAGLRALLSSRCGVFFPRIPKFRGGSIEGECPMGLHGPGGCRFEPCRLSFR